MMGRKDKVVSDLTKGIEFLFKKNKVDYIVGEGFIKDAATVIAQVSDHAARQSRFSTPLAS